MDLLSIASTLKAPTAKEKLNLKRTYLDRIPPCPPQEILKLLDRLSSEDHYVQGARVVLKDAQTLEEHEAEVSQWKGRVLSMVKKFIKGRRARYLQRLKVMMSVESPDLVITPLAQDLKRGYDHLDTLLSPYIEAAPTSGGGEVVEDEKSEESEEPDGWPVREGGLVGRRRRGKGPKDAGMVEAEEDLEEALAAGEPGRQPCASVGDATKRARRNDGASTSADGVAWQDGLAVGQMVTRASLRGKATSNK